MLEVLQLIVRQEPAGLVVVLRRVPVADEQDLALRDDRNVGHQRVDATFLVDRGRLPQPIPRQGDPFRCSLPSVPGFGLGGGVQRSRVDADENRARSPWLSLEHSRSLTLIAPMERPPTNTASARVHTRASRGHVYPYTP